MEEQCSVHSTHWGTLKFTVILPKIHCTDPHVHAARKGEAGISWVECTGKEAKERSGEVYKKGKKKKSAAGPILGQVTKG